MLAKATLAVTTLTAVVACSTAASAAPTFRSTPAAQAKTRAATNQAATADTAALAAVSAPYSPTNPSTWSAAQLAAQLTFTCVDVSSPSAAIAYAAAGYGGVGFVGSNAPADLASVLRTVRAAAPNGVPPVIWSDEEGGQVQRLANVIYPLPSAKTMGTWSTTRIEATARAYGARMRALGVPVDFAPDADLATPGHFIDAEQRAFAADPATDAADVVAFATGLRQAGVVPVVKHWPGHGETGNSHTGIAVTPPLSTMQQRDMVPFESAFAHGVSTVMVGHLVVPGLSESPTTPASESPRALAYLRAQAGPDATIITDSLNMASASSALGISPGEAAVRALVAGADAALSCTPTGVVASIASAINGGRLGRSAAVAKARRVLSLKAAAGVVAAATGGHDLMAVADGHTGSGQVEVHSLSEASGYETFDLHAATPLRIADPAAWQFVFGPYGEDNQEDLFAIHLHGTGSGHVEVHVLSQASGYRTYLAHVATPLAAVAPDQWQFQIASTAGDHRADLVAVRYVGGGSGRVEVHVLSAASGYQSWTMHAATALAPTTPGGWEFLIGDRAGRGNLVAVKRSGASGHTEAHTLSYDSGYRTFVLHRALPLAAIPQAWAEYSLAEMTGDGTPDLVLAKLQQTGSAHTEIHVLDGSSGFARWSLHSPTALAPLDPAGWRLAGATY